MNPVDSDLEEGEILDDSPSSSPLNKKHRELPQRYIVHEKASPVNKHKKDCKYAIHCHTKKVAKSPKLKNCHKRHHKSSCSRVKSRRPFNSTNVEKNFSKNSHFPDVTLIAEIKGSLRDHPVKKKCTKYVSKLENISEIEKNKKCDSSRSEISRENAGTQLGNSNSLNSSNHSDQLSSHNTEEVVEVSSSSDTNVSTNVLCNSTKENVESEDEDEEELRRIALATFTKRKVVIESSENLVKNTDCNAASVPEPAAINIQTSNHGISSPSSDNYEIVDMEVDEDIPASIEILDNSGIAQSLDFTENLFVIDTKPSEDYKQNVQENTPPITRNSSDEDFEADILRAELIESLYRKKSLTDECAEEKKSNIKMHEKQVSTMLDKKHVGKYKKLNANFYQKQVRTAKHIVRKNAVIKTENLQCSKPSSPVLVSKPSERLVIALNEESSSEDSADSESENPVASIEALISDCRQKSDSNEIDSNKTRKVVTNVPKAVSCLSKAQQEEYTSLMNILAKKKKLQGQSDTFQHKNGSVPFVELKLLEKQLIGFKETLRKKKELMSYLSREINSKKLLYLKSKITAQQLKQQYLAADKIRKANLFAWSKSCSDLKTVKKTVSSIESKILHLENQCAKVSASLPKRTINISSLPA